ncbi:transposase [Streptococcus mutans]|uniref:transposase n=1 Tax=Streptococcus mutans TaxID=1309 RepID=UPI00034C9E5F|nr:transposase [Streptococcus mutans]
MPRKVFDKTSKIAVVKLILEEEQLVKMISSALGVYPNSLYQVQEYNNMKKKRTNISKRS